MTSPMDTGVRFTGQGVRVVTVLNLGTPVAAEVSRYTGGMNLCQGRQRHQRTLHLSTGLLFGVLTNLFWTGLH